MFDLTISVISKLITTLIISSCCILIKPANANLFVTPMYLKMESEQGQSKGVLQIGNTSSQSITVRLSTTAFTYDRNGIFQRLEPNSNMEQDLTPYLRYSPTEMVIPGNSSRRVRLIGLLPPSLPSGEYRTAIFAETLQEKTNDQGQKVGFNISIGSALYVVKGEAVADINVVQSDLNPQNKQLKILVANQGSATAKGTIHWTLKQGKKVVDSGESGSTFLANSQTNILLNGDRFEKTALPSGNYQLEGEIVWELSTQEKTSSFDFELEL